MDWNNACSSEHLSRGGAPKSRWLFSLTDGSTDKKFGAIWVQKLFLPFEVEICKEQQANGGKMPLALDRGNEACPLTW